MDELTRMVTALSRYGEVMLVSANASTFAKRGELKAPTWWCKVDLFVTGEGMSAKVMSQMGIHREPLDAVVECTARLMELSRTAAKALPTVGG